MPSARTLRRELVAGLERRGSIRSAAVRRAFSAVPRERFVPDIAAREGLERVYADVALVTRTNTHGAPLSSSSQPTIMAEMLEHLELRPGLRVLEVGTGTGYNAALLSTLVAPSGSVTSVELESDVAERAEAALRAGGYPVSVVVADAHDVLENTVGAYDRILLTASSDAVPRQWRDALVEAGLLELPLRLAESAGGGQVVVTFRREGDELRSVGVVPGGFMNLRRQGQDDRLQPDVVTLSVSEVVWAQGRALANLSGPGLAELSRRARRRLAGVMLGPPRVRAVQTPVPASSSLVPYLGSAVVRDGVGVRTFRSGADDRIMTGAGVATKDGRGLALALGRAGQRRCRIEVYGEGAMAARAEASLQEVIRRWRRAGKPTLADCSITVTYRSRKRSEAAVIDSGRIELEWPS